MSKQQKIMYKTLPSLNSLFFSHVGCSLRFGALRKSSSRQSFYGIVFTFSRFSKNTSYDLHMWTQYCHLLEYIPSLVYLDHPDPSISSSRWCPFCLEKFLHVQVPLGCVKTAFVTQGLGSCEPVKTIKVNITKLAQPWWNLGGTLVRTRCNLGGTFRTTF